MKTRVAACVILASLAPSLSAAQITLPAPSQQLTLDQAVRLAVEHNRQIASARLQVAKADDQVAIARTRRLPIFSTEATASQLLSPVSFSFPAGSFGDFPTTGPIPSTDTSVTVPRRPTMFVQSSISQPLTRLIKANLGLWSTT